VVVFGEEQAGGGVSGEVAAEPASCGFDANSDAMGDGRIGGGQAYAQRFGVELRDGEDADAALMATGFAGEPLPGAGGGVGKGGVKNGKKLGDGRSPVSLAPGWKYPAVPDDQPDTRREEHGQFVEDADFHNDADEQHRQGP
jgi:hypothetical protein